MTISQMAEDTAQLIKTLGYEKVHLLGWSMGSRIAMEVALKHPDMVNTLILCSPNPGGKHQAPRKSDAYARLTAKELSPEEASALIFPVTPEGKKAAASYFERLTKAITIGSVPDDLDVSSEALSKSNSFCMDGLLCGCRT